VLICLALFVLYWYVYERTASQGWRQLFSTQRWLVFALTGLVMAPVCIKAHMTVGGSVNHIANFCYFLALGATLGMSRFMTAADSPAKAGVAKVLAAIMIAAGLPGVLETISFSAIKHGSKPPEVQLAYLYEMRHPGRAYFPRFPLAEIYARHLYYHFDGALIDRQIADHPVTRAQLVAGIPGDAAVIAVSPGERLSLVLEDYLSNWPQTTDPELPGWTIYQRPAAAGQTPP
jgi:hypothetical protein